VSILLGRFRSRLSFALTEAFRALTTVRGTCGARCLVHVMCVVAEEEPELSPLIATLLQVGVCVVSVFD
jgi:hypothetical protein